MRRSLIVNAIIDAIVLAGAFFFLIWLKPATVRVYIPKYIEPFLIFLGIWVFISLIAKKYTAPERYSLSRATIFILITNIFILSVAALFMYLTNWMQYSRLIVYGTILITTTVELIFAFCDYFICHASVGPDTSKVFEAYKKVVGRQDPEPEKEIFPVESTLGEVPSGIKEAIIEESNEEVYNFLVQNIDLSIPNYSLLSTTTRFNILKLPEKVYLKIVNLKRINDIRFVNKFFEAANSKLASGGLFIGCVETKDQRKKRILKKYPPVLNRIYYFFDYIVKRVFPKFNLTKRIYFFLTRGNNRVLSKAETFGRLYSCGFEFIKDIEIHGYLYFIARKVKDPLLAENPSYGPLIKLKRYGKDGKIIHVYKFRTMHPFAEFLQEYIYKHSNLQEGGKFKDDFRITTVGKLFRKFWIDELPMFINFFKGEMKLVGVRPLSKHYFSLYSKELQEKRLKYKPGLIPPFYVDMPKTLEEIQASEMKYLNAYEKHPFRTDWKYFWKAIGNILFKKARSA